MLFAPSCVVCSARGTELCASCARSLTPAPESPPPPGLDWFGCLFAYQGAARELIVNMKYRNSRSSVALVAAPLAELAHPALEGWLDRTVITWAPTSGSRRRARGYDQSRLLATEVGQRLGLPTRGLLRRYGASPQTGLPRRQRLRGPSFGARHPVPACVLVVDDVCTTGATLSAAACALRGEGAERLIALCLARTPLNHAIQLADNSN